MLQQIAKIVCAVLLLFLSKDSFGQQCTNRFTSLIYKGISFDTFTTSIYASTKDIIAAGNISNDHGFAAKFSPGGSPLFAYQYNPIYQLDRTYFMTMKFTDIIETRDGSFLLAGNVIQDKFIGTIEIVNRLGVLLKLDKFGNVLWSKKFESANGISNGGFQLAMTNVMETSTGDIVGYLASDYGRNYPAYGRIVCFSSDGSQKWNTLLATNDYDGGVKSLDSKRVLTQASNGSIIVGDMLYKSDRSGPALTTLAAQLHFFSLDVASGKLKWETNYQYPISTTVIYSDVTSVSELSTDKFVFTTSVFSPNGIIKKGLRIETDGKGVVQSAIAFQSGTGTSTELVDVATDKSSGYQTYLLKNTGSAMLVALNPSGTILWQRGLHNSGGLFPVNCFSKSINGYGILMSNFKSRESRLLLTDTTGRVDCANTELQLLTEPIVLNKGLPLITEPGIPDQNRFGSVNFPIRADAYPFEKRIECEEQASCCNDVIDSTNMLPINICEGNSYTLSDNTVLRTSGTYYVVYKTPGGCDSIKFYKLVVNKNPSALTLGNDICLDGKDSAILKATVGYHYYSWMNTLPITDNEFKITDPGIYHVRVMNICGSKTDTITVFKECDFTIYLPNAFSPNGDGRNDFFGVPPQNKNKLIRLQIFNRWGQLVFHTQNAVKAWDGKMNKQPQATGVYIYFVEMKGLSGNMLTQKGTVLLLR